MRHLAIIADGNRRWARAHGLDAELGHTHGLAAFERCAEWAIKNNVPYLTLFALSTENLGREKAEVEHIFDLARSYFVTRREWYVENGIKVLFLGRKDRMPQDVVGIMFDMEAATRRGENLTLCICCDYGGRDEIARAAAHGALSETAITEALTAFAPEPDMILRTGGRHRLSNFMLWQAAYAEILFSDTLFPDLDFAVLDDAARWYDKQVRNFGK